MPAENIKPKEFTPTAQDLKDAPARSRKIFTILKKTYPHARCSLHHKNPLQLLIATILSAQCTDERVNIVTESLFKKYRSCDAFIKVDQAELAEDIKSTGFYRNKAKNIQAACRQIRDEHDSKVPADLDALVALPGVGRKTANVILGNAFDIPGIVTDTHVIRLSRLMGLSPHQDPVKLEHDLMNLVPKKNWTLFSHLLVFHGRNICIARKPACDDCPVRPHCCFGRKGVPHS